MLMFEDNSCSAFCFRHETNFDLARPGNIRHEFPISVQVPAQHHPRWWFPIYDPAPVAFPVILTLLIPATAAALLHHSRARRTSTDMVLLRPPLAHILSKHLEGAVYVSVYDDRPSNDASFFGLLHGEVWGLRTDWFR